LSKAKLSVCRALAPLCAAMAPLSLVLLLSLICGHVARSSELACDGPGGTCSAEDGEDASALQLRAGQRELEVSSAASTSLPYDYVTHRDLLEELLEIFAGSYEKVDENLGEYLRRGECKLSGPDACPITDSTLFVPGTPTKVYPGGKTTCLDGSDYYFEVVAGNPEKLHIHFQGGGACWDWLSFTKGGCSTRSYPMKPEGVFNLSDPLNPLGNYSYIAINYCSGDMHAGDTVQFWNWTWVQQRGYENAYSAIKYGLSQFPKLTNLAITGSSAGSLGVQVWSGKVLELFADRKADVAVVADSFMGVIWPPEMTDKSEAWLFGKFKMCNPGLLTSAAQCKQCHAGNLLVEDLYLDAMKSNRDSRFSAVNSKSDFVQVVFEKAFELTAEFNVRGLFMTQGQFYKAMSLMLVDWLKQPNFKSYLVQSRAHTYLPNNNTYFASPVGNQNATGDPNFIDWLTDFISPSKDAATSVCYGPSKKIGRLTPVTKEEVEYCAAGLDATA